MTETLEETIGTDYDGTGTDVYRIFHEEDPDFVGPPTPTAIYGRRSDWKFAENYQA